MSVCVCVINMVAQRVLDLGGCNALVPLSIVDDVAMTLRSHKGTAPQQHGTQTHHRAAVVVF